jgi:hypothetical protein
MIAALLLAIAAAQALLFYRLARSASDATYWRTRCFKDEAQLIVATERWIELVERILVDETINTLANRRKAGAMPAREIRPTDRELSPGARSFLAQVNTPLAGAATATGTGAADPRDKDLPPELSAERISSLASRKAAAIERAIRLLAETET